MKRKSIAVLLSFSILIGCVGNDYHTPYKKGPFGSVVGFTVKHQQGNVYQITFVGVNTSTRKRVNDLALLRAAEVMKELGYDFFQVVHSANSVRRMTSGGRYGPRLTMSILKRLIHIKGLKQKESNGLNYDVNQLIPRLSQQYDIEILEVIKDK